MTAAVRRLQSLASLLAHVRERLGVDIGFVLWDGSTVPADLKNNAMAFAIADEGAVAALMMGVGSAQPVGVDDAAFIATSFTGFVELMRSLGGDFS